MSGAQQSSKGYRNVVLPWTPAPRHPVQVSRSSDLLCSPRLRAPFPPPAQKKGRVNPTPLARGTCSLSPRRGAPPCRIKSRARPTGLWTPPAQLIAQSLTRPWGQMGVVPAPDQWLGQAGLCSCALCPPSPAHQGPRGQGRGGMAQGRCLPRLAPPTPKPPPSSSPTSRTGPLLPGHPT